MQTYVLGTSIESDWEPFTSVGALGCYWMQVVNTGSSWANHAGSVLPCNFFAFFIHSFNVMHAESCETFTELIS